MFKKLMISDTSPQSLIGLPQPRLEELMADMGESRFRARQLMRWMYKDLVTDPAQMTDLGKDFRQSIQKQFEWNLLTEAAHEVSSDGTEKYLFRTTDGETIESVWIPMPDRFTLCVSSQVGCRMGCRFCTTATMGLKRNLSSAEIISQVLMVRRAHPITNIVFMGMGEPFDNYDVVVDSINILCNDLGFTLSARRVTVSTSGLVPRIRQYSKECRTQLAVSLNSTTDELRYQLMPVNKRYPIDEIISAVDECYGNDRRRVTFEYILMKDVNDSDEDARRLAKLLRGLPCKVNLILYNPNPVLPFKRPEKDRVLAFQNLLLRGGYNATIRWSRGLDIAAACGQLKSRVDKEEHESKASEDRSDWRERAIPVSGP